jgi:hypothetical protein
MDSISVLKYDVRPTQAAENSLFSGQFQGFLGLSYSAT